MKSFTKNKYKTEDNLRKIDFLARIASFHEIIMKKQTFQTDDELSYTNKIIKSVYFHLKHLV